MAKTKNAEAKEEEKTKLAKSLKTKEETPKKVATKSDKKDKKAPAKKESSSSASSSEGSSSSSSESEDEKPKKKPVTAGTPKKEDKKAPAKKESSSSSASSSSEEEEEEEKPKAKAAPAAAAAKKAEKMETSSGSGSDSESGSGSGSGSSSSEEEEEDEKPAAKKRANAEDDGNSSAKKQGKFGGDSNGSAPASVFVGGISWNATEEQVKEKLESYEVGEITGVRIITDAETGRSRGFGYVDCTEESANKILALTDVEVDGRTLRFDKAEGKSSKTNTPQRPRSAGFGGSSAPSNDPSSTLFVKNLSFDADDNALWGVFTSAANVRIITDRETGKARGFGYVDFNNTDEAKAALEQFQGAEIAGRPVTLDYAQPRDKEGGSRGGFGGGRGGRGGGRGFGDRGGRGFRGGDRGRGGRGSFGGRGGRGGSGGNFAAKQANKGSIAEFSGSKVSFDD